MQVSQEVFFLTDVREDSTLLVKTTGVKSIKTSPCMFRGMRTAVPVGQRSLWYCQAPSGVWLEAAKKMDAPVFQWWHQKVLSGQYSWLSAFLGFCWSVPKYTDRCELEECRLLWFPCFFCFYDEVCGQKREQVLREREIELEGETKVSPFPLQTLKLLFWLLPRINRN